MAPDTKTLEMKTVFQRGSAAVEAWRKCDEQNVHTPYPRTYILSVVTPYMLHWILPGPCPPLHLQGLPRKKSFNEPLITEYFDGGVRDRLR